LAWKSVLQYQRRDLGDYVEEMVELMGYRRHLIRAFRPVVRRWLLRKSPYYRGSKHRSLKQAPATS